MQYIYVCIKYIGMYTPHSNDSNHPTHSNHSDHPNHSKMMAPPHQSFAAMLSSNDVRVAFENYWKQSDHWEQCEWSNGLMVRMRNCRWYTRTKYTKSPNQNIQKYKIYKICKI